MKKIFNKLKIILIIGVIVSILGFFYNGVSTSSGITQIIPVNVATNNFVCYSITAARSAGNTLMVSNGGLKYSVLDKNIYKRLEQSVGKPITISYEKRRLSLNPCLNSGEYVIKEIKDI